MERFDNELVPNVDPGGAGVAGMVEVGGPGVHAQPDQVVLARLQPPPVPAAKLVDLVRVELKHIQVVEQQRPDEDLVVRVDVRDGLVQEVAGRLEDLEQAHRHQRPVEEVLRPSLLVEAHHVVERHVGQLVAGAHRRGVRVEVMAQALEVLQRMEADHPEGEAGQGRTAEALDEVGVAALHAVERGEGEVATGRAAEADAGAVGTGHDSAQLGKAGGAVGAQLVGIQDGGERLLDKKGVAGLHGLDGDDMAARRRAVLDGKKRAEFPDGLVVAELQLGNGDGVVVGHDDGLVGDLLAAGQAAAQVMQGRHGRFVLSLLQCFLLSVQQLLAVQKGLPDKL